MVRQTQGYDTQVAFGKESTFGTAPAAGTFKSWGIIDSFEVEINKNHEAMRGLGSRTVLMTKAGQQETTPSLSAYLQDPTIFYYALGKVVKTGAANAWVHTITPVGRCEELPSFTAQSNMCINGAPYVTNYLGSKIDNLTISGSNDGPVTVEADIISKTFADAATPASSYTTILNNPLTFADGVVTINGNAAGNVTEFEIEIANNLDAVYTISKGNSPSMISDGVLDVTGSLTIAVAYTAQRTLFTAGTEFDIKLRFDDPAVPANYIEITGIGARYDSDSLSNEADGAVDYELDVLFRDIRIVAGSKDVSDLTV
ncbi:phage tail tube protein [Bacillus thuringiensis]|uniref:phage tail tube protein n=1 Tax=Bacillus thuringiensis TaxID=1428 RepID=UPI00159C0EB7|nr:phage tail tube protein [Bacillus thuringiensis]